MKKVKILSVYLLGLLLLAIGINISKISGLGISPISSVSYTVELIWGIELGKASIIVYIFLILFQVLLLRKDYQTKNLLQLVPTYLLGMFITYTSANYLLFWLPEPTLYVARFIYSVIGVLFTGTGVSLFLMANIMALPAEGLSQAIVEVSKGKIKIGNAKIIVDSSMVALSIIMSLIFMESIKSVREGTILAAFFVGKIIDFMMDNYYDKIMIWVEKGESEEATLEA